MPETFKQAAVPVARMGRASTDDAQDPTLSLPRQLENSRNALPPGFVIVAKFYDVESGRNTVEWRGTGTAHQRFDIPIPRDDGIADLPSSGACPLCYPTTVACHQSGVASFPTATSASSRLTNDRHTKSAISRSARQAARKEHAVLPLRPGEAHGPSDIGGAPHCWVPVG